MPTSAPAQSGQQSATAEDSRLHREDVGGDAGGQEDRQGVVAQHDAEEDGGCHEPAIRPRPPRLPGPLPAHEQDQQAGREREVEGVGIGEAAHAPRDRREREQEAGPDGDGGSARQLAHEDHGEAGGDREVDRRQGVHPEGSLAGRREGERREPAQDDVAGVAGRVGRSEDGRHRLELPGVPEPLAGKEHAAGEAEGHDPHEDGRGRGQQRARDAGQGPPAGPDAFTSRASGPRRSPTPGWRRTPRRARRQRPGAPCGPPRAGPGSAPSRGRPPRAGKARSRG